MPSQYILLEQQAIGFANTLALRPMRKAHTADGRCYG